MMKTAPSQMMMNMAMAGTIAMTGAKVTIGTLVDGAAMPGVKVTTGAKVMTSKQMNTKTTGANVTTPKVTAAKQTKTISMVKYEGFAVSLFFEIAFGAFHRLFTECA